MIYISQQGYSKNLDQDDGKGLHWVTDINAEIPVKLTKEGAGSERATTLSVLFMNQVQWSGKRNCLVAADNRAWTWDDYKTQAFSFAKTLHVIGVTDRSSVAIMGFNSPEWLFAYIGAILYNCVSTGIYTTNQQDACQFQVEHSGAEVIVVQSREMLDKFDMARLSNVKAVVVWSAKKSAKGYYCWKDFMNLGIDVEDKVVLTKIEVQKPGQCCTLIYTSGTTGRPKGCMLSHDNLCWVANNMMDRLANSDPTSLLTYHRVVSYLPLSHIAGLAHDIIQHIAVGHTVYFAGPDAMQGTLIQTLKSVKPTIFFGVPRVWEKFEEKLKEHEFSSILKWALRRGAEKIGLEQNKKPPPFSFQFANILLYKIKKELGLHRCGVYRYGAAPIKPSTLEFFASLGIPLLNTYGMSETTGGHTLHTPLSYKLETAGVPAPGTELKILNPDENGEGEICMRGRNMMMGYLKNDEETQKAFDQTGFLLSGDLGRLDEDGHLIITGRIKELIISAGGENIAPVPIESLFKQFCVPCSHILIVGDKQRFLVCLITLKVLVDQATGWPSQYLTNDVISFLKNELQVVGVRTSVEASRHPKVINYVNNCIDLTNKQSVSRAAHLKKFMIVPTDFSVPGGELTPTLKVKRRVTEQKYRTQIDELFSQHAKL